MPFPLLPVDPGKILLLRVLLALMLVVAAARAGGWLFRTPRATVAEFFLEPSVMESNSGHLPREPFSIVILPVLGTAVPTNSIGVLSKAHLMRCREVRPDESRGRTA